MTLDRIAIDLDIMFGKPGIKGTRITVEHVLHKLAGGIAVQEIIEDHPHLTPDDVCAAANYLAQQVITHTLLDVPVREG